MSQKNVPVKDVAIDEQEKLRELMAKMRVMVVKYGYAVVEADTESKAIELANNMNDGDFDWSDFDDAQVIDDDIDFE